MSSNLCLSMDSILMPANDYIITGDKKYIDDFSRLSADLESCMREMEEYCTCGVATDKVEEREILEVVETAWQHIREISLRIFAGSHPTTGRKAKRLMGEMDYQWAYPAVERLQKWREMRIEEYRAVTESLKKTLRRTTSIIMDTGHAMVAVLCNSFAFLPSNLLTIRNYSVCQTIKKLQKGAEIIAGGNLDHRIDIHTGDELEQLAKMFNIMGERLKGYYAALEDKMKERTKDLHERIDALERFRKVTIEREFRMKELKDEIQYLKSKIQELAKG